MAFGAVIALSTVVAFYALVASEGHSRVKKNRIRHWEGNQDDNKTSQELRMLSRSLSDCQSTI